MSALKLGSGSVARKVSITGALSLALEEMAAYGSLFSFVVFAYLRPFGLSLSKPFLFCLGFFTA